MIFFFQFLLWLIDLGAGLFNSFKYNYLTHTLDKITSCFLHWISMQASDTSETLLNLSIHHHQFFIVRRPLSNCWVWFAWVLWHINHCRLFNAESSSSIYIKYIRFGFVGFYGISTIVGYLMLNPLYTYILNIYDLIWLGFMAYQPLLVI